MPTLMADLAICRDIDSIEWGQRNSVVTACGFHTLLATR